MRFRAFFSVAGSILLLSCGGNSGIEESVKIYDADMNARFIQILDEENVTYRIAPDGQIFYPIEQRKIVEAAQEAIFGPVDESTKGARVQVQDADDIASNLTTLGINYEVIHNEKDVVFKWSAGVDASAMRVVSEVVSAREESEK
jgi:hypothetical protein